MLTENQLKQLQSILERTYKDLKQQLGANNHFGLDQALADESTGELSRYDNHPGDLGTEQFERSKDLALNEHAKRQLKEIEEALQAMKEGRYGFCQTCQAPISYERLLALPTALYCLKHSADASISQDRPVEEERLAPSFGQFDLDQQDKTFYDAEDTWQEVASYGSSDSPSDLERQVADYDKMYTEAEELVGAVDELEGFLLADMEGRFIGVNENHEAYEQYLDENNISSLIEESGLINVVMEDEEEEK